ncbi:MAG: hypothetical protein WCA57_12810 [Ilumatobacteraceae bacterium]
MTIGITDAELEENLTVTDRSPTIAILRKWCARPGAGSDRRQVREERHPRVPLLLVPVRRSRRRRR